MNRSHLHDQEDEIYALVLVQNHSYHFDFLAFITLFVLRVFLEPPGSFMVFYGYHPSFVTLSLWENSKVHILEYHIKHQQQVLQLLKDNVTLEGNRMKHQTYQHRIEKSFDVVD